MTTGQLFRLTCLAASLLAMQAGCAQVQPTAKGVADLEQAKRDAVEADRALRASAPPEKPKAPAISGDSASERFEKAADAAFIDR
ncbi:MAG TPA: hypothetical protein VFS02_13940, partial [Telluria sp.]|nr:hypothetical protein [Telluria sp.]